MTDLTAFGPDSDEQALKSEVTRLNKIVRALMNRVERGMSVQGSGFGLFQTAIILEDQVRRRTEDLEAALRENERINRDLQHEIQERRRTQEALHQSEERYRAATKAALDAFLTIDEDFTIVFANPAAEIIFGYPAADLSGRALATLMPPASREQSLAAIRDYLQICGDRHDWHGLQLTCQHRDGHEIPMEFSFGKFRQDGKRLYTGIARDITRRKQAEREVQELQDKLRDQAIRDPLTGLYNRRYLDDMFDRELARAERCTNPVCVVLGDIDRFKAVNDTYGHPAGDEVLKAFGDVLKRHTRSTDIVCRYGGEEFLIVFAGMTREDAYKRTEQLRLAFAATLIAAGAATIHTTASFGFAVYPEHGKTGADLIAAADVALYAAKDAGRNQVRRYVAGMKEEKEPE